MRISFILPPVNLSGGIRVVAIHAERLLARGHSVQLVSPMPPKLGLMQRVREWLGRSLGSKTSRTLEEWIRVPHHVLDSCRQIEDADVPDGDIVVATWWETAEWVSRLGPAKGQKVYFVQGHEVFPWLPQERCRATYRLPMQKIVVSRWLADIMKFQYGDDQVVIAPNGVDGKQFHAEKRQKQDVKTVGFLYARGSGKGVDMTLRVIEKLRTKWPELRVVSFAPIDLDRKVSFPLAYHKDPEQAKLKDIYASCDVWLTSSRSEGFNLPAAEAMACRTPVVATRTGWPAHAIVDGVNGYCVDVDDEEAFYRAVAAVLSATREEWLVLSHGAHATASVLSWDVSCSLFEDALKGARGGKWQCT